MKPLGEKLWRLREARGLTQEALAEALGVSRQTVSNWENDKATPDAEKLQKLCETLGVSADALLDLAPAPARPAKKKRVYALFLAVFSALFVLGAVLMFLPNGGNTSSTVVFTEAFLWGMVCLFSLAGLIVSAIFLMKK